MNNQRAIFALAFLLTVSSVGLAGPIVQFGDGRAMEVQSVEREADLAVIELVGGGTFSVPHDIITNWDDINRHRVIARTPPVPQVAAIRASNVQPADYHMAVRTDGGDRWRRAAGRYADLLQAAADRHDVDPVLLTAVAHVESRFNPEAVSPKGAMGLLQLMPATAERFGVSDAHDVAQNVEAGARYLRWLLERYEGRTDLALAGYNAGEQAVDRYNGIPPYSETRTYVTRVLNQFQRLSATN